MPVTEIQSYMSYELYKYSAVYHGSSNTKSPHPPTLKPRQSKSQSASGEIVNGWAGSRDCSAMRAAPISARRAPSLLIDALRGG